MPDIFRYSIVVFLKNPPINSVINIKNWKHITLKRRFKLQNTTLRKLKRLIADIIARHQSFDIVFGKNCYFNDDGFLTKYVSIETNPKLTALHSDFVDKLKNFTETRDPQFENKNYIPHLLISENDKTDYKGRSIKIDKAFLLKEINNKKDKRIIAEFRF